MVNNHDDGMYAMHKSHLGLNDVYRNATNFGWSLTFLNKTFIHSLQIF